MNMLEQKYQEEAYQRYLEEGKLPWSEGYSIAHDKAVREVFASHNLMQSFAESNIPLPIGYGQNLDERLIEWPWVLTHIPPKSYRILDAGSAMNHHHVLSYPIWKNKKLDIMTLAPESYCAWKKGISYLFYDLRNIPYKDEEFDVIISVSTLEHIGMDNRKYDNKTNEHNNHDIFKVLLEFHRILKNHGILLFTVPYGQYEDHNEFQQFDENLLEQCATVFSPKLRKETFFLYTSSGWVKSSKENCAHVKYALPPSQVGRQPDNAAAARCVACCEWHI